ncbi:hypothetical protein DPMN_078255 [Dreissena polymorpha]|uniref:Uncharacterized protein n=1 Tax=Dreissena polymorpha TaxID=45954 RepID=A0A9D3YQV3_DREPO|nr:hypothetical protein DPMN_078255 [Dreissena polymorpha]
MKLACERSVFTPCFRSKTYTRRRSETDYVLTSSAPSGLTDVSIATLLAVERVRHVTRLKECGLYIDHVQYDFSRMTIAPDNVLDGLLRIMRDNLTFEAFHN